MRPSSTPQGAMEVLPGTRPRWIAYHRGCGCDLAVLFEWRPNRDGSWSYVPMGVDLKRSLFCGETEKSHLTAEIDYLLSAPPPKERPDRTSTGVRQVVADRGEATDPLQRDLLKGVL